MPKIRLRTIRKRFGSNQVLDGVNLDVAPGESMAIIGGSGTGKSVLLKCIIGLLRPDEGTVEVDGVNVAGRRGSALEHVRRKFGMLFQGAALFDSLPVWENVSFGLLAEKKVNRDQAKELAASKLAQVGLAGEVG